LFQVPGEASGGNSAYFVYGGFQRRVFIQLPFQGLDRQAEAVGEAELNKSKHTIEMRVGFGQCFTAAQNRLSSKPPTTRWWYVLILVYVFALYLAWSW